MSSEQKPSRFVYQVLLAYALLWLLLLSQARADIWLVIAIPVSLTYCGFMARTMLLHGRMGTSADIPAFPAAALALLLTSGALLLAGRIEPDLGFVLDAISRLCSAWLLSHAALLLVAIIASKLCPDGPP